MENLKKLILIVEGPSGVGKDTIINKILKMYPDRFGKPINATTREMRPNESQGDPYLFIDENEFFRMRMTGEIFEHTIRHGTYRGMRKSSFNGILNSGKIAIRDCDRYGLEALKEEYGEIVVGIFLTCPKEMIIERLISRNEPEESMKSRIADYDLCMQSKDYFDYEIVNIDMNETIEEIIKIADKYTM
jgi:guanylate kinase